MNEHKKNLKGFALALLIIAISGISSRSICQNCGTTCQTVKDVNTIVHNGNNFPTIHHQISPMNILTYESTTHFRVYFADDILPLNSLTLENGFDQSSLHGNIRRQTFLAVLNYLETIISIPSGVVLDIFVDYSYDDAAPMNPEVDWLAMGAPIYPPGFNTQQGVYTPYIQTHILTGIDPNTDPRAYDGYLQFSFRYIGAFGTDDFDFWDDYTYTSGYNLNYRYDLYSIILHEMLHVLGIYSNISQDMTQTNRPPIATQNSFTNFDCNFIYYLSNGIHPESANLTPMVTYLGANPIINPVLANTIIPLNSGHIWLNKKNKPNNHNLEKCPDNLYNLSHISQNFYSYGQYSPGYGINYSLATPFRQNEIRHLVTLPELRILSEMGYPIVSGLTNTLNNSPCYTNAFSYNNTTPDLTRSHSQSNSNFPDLIQPQYTITNNNTPQYPTNTTLTINIQDIELGLVDAESDDLIFLPNSLFGIQGVSSYGNNHDQLSISPDAQTITFTPLPHYHGLAQFGIKVTDQVEIESNTYTGALIFVTILINPGNVSITPGDELIINGGFEDGTEFRQIGVNSTKPYSSIYLSKYIGEFFSGISLSGAHPFPNNNTNTDYHRGIIVKDIACQNLLSPAPHFIPFQSFGTHLNSVNNPPYNNPYNYAQLLPQSGERYHPFFENNTYSLLKTDIIACKNYTIEFDIIKPQNYTTTDTYYLDFIDPTVPIDPDNPTITQTVPLTVIPVPGSWKHYSLTFSFCGKNTKMIRMRNTYQYTSIELLNKKTFIDNISLKEELQNTFVLNHDNPNMCNGDDILLSLQTLPCPNSTIKWYIRYNSGLWTLYSTTNSPNCTITPAPSGSYQFQAIIQSASCAAYSSNIISVVVPDPIQISYTQINEDCYGSVDGEISIQNITGGTPPYALEWYYYSTLLPSFSNQFTANHLIKGNYDLVITDVNGCLFSHTFVLPNTRPELWPLQPKSQDSKDRGTAISSDNDGNIYVAGKFDANIGFCDPNFNTISLSNSGGYGGLYLAAIDPCGYTTWAEKIDVTGATITDMVYDDQNIYICGEFYYSMIFDPGNTNLTLTASGNKDLFLACYSSGGIFQWARQISGADDNDQLKAVCVDNNHNIYITGSFKSPVLTFQTGGTINNSNSSGTFFDAYIGKYTPTGIFLNASAYGTANEDNTSNDITFTEPTAIQLVTIGRNGNFLGGYKVYTSLTPVLTYSGPLGYEGLSVCYQNLFLNIIGKSISTTGENYFKVRTNSITPNIGTVEDFGILGPIFSIESADVLATNNNSFFILGNSFETDFNYPLVNPILSLANSSPGFVEHFLIKQDLNPNPQNWIQHSEGPFNEVAMKMTRTPNGNIYYTGYFDFVCILDPNILVTNDQDSYIARIIDEQITGTYAKPNLVNQGIGKSKENTMINIYPNPCLDKLVIDTKLFNSTAQIQICISDITGRKIMTLHQPGDGIDQLNVPTNSLIPGLYFVTIYNTKGVFKTKFIKQ